MVAVVPNRIQIKTRTLWEEEEGTIQIQGLIQRIEFLEGGLVRVL